MPPLNPSNNPQQINSRQNPKRARRCGSNDQRGFAGLDELTVLGAKDAGEGGEETGERV